MPGHGASSRMGGVVAGGARGCCQRAKASITIMRPPQQGHGGRVPSGSAGVSFSGGGATASSGIADAAYAPRKGLIRMDYMFLLQFRRRDRCDSIAVGITPCHAEPGRKSASGVGVAGKAFGR